MQNHVRVGVGVIIKKGDSILLGKRAIDPLEDGYIERENNKRETWTIPGGKLEIGESIIDCAKRETLEETGVIVDNLKFLSVNDATESTGYFLTIGFLSEDFSGEAKTTEPNKITDWQWFDLSNLPEPLFEPCRQVIESYKQNKSYIQ